MVNFVKCLILIGSYATQGWVLQQWWWWFIVPYGIPMLTYGEAVLLRAAVFLFTRDATRPVENKKTPNEILGWALMFTFVSPAIVYGMGYLIKTYLWGV